MRLISSKLTWWHKRGFPAIWFTGVGLGFCFSLVDFLRGRESGELVLIPPAMAAFYYLYMRSYVFPLMDDVWIDGDDFIVRNRGEEERFPIANIIDVEGSYLMNPEHIGIILEPPSRFGKWIRFAAGARCR